MEITIRMTTPLYIALLPVPAFYLIYFRHFFSYYRERGHVPVQIKHLESFLYGIALALLLVLVAPYIDSFLPRGSIMLDAFIKAALVEKAGALLVIFLILKNYPSFTILEGVISAILVGIGFSLVENTFYAMNFGTSVIIVRVLFSVPLHLTTCGIAGYFLGLSKLSSTVTYKIFHITRAVCIPMCLHGLFDSLLLLDGMHSYFVGPMVILMVGSLELFIARSKLVPSRTSLAEEKLRMEDWQLRYRQPRYERWILNSMGTPNSRHIPFFRAPQGIYLPILSVSLALTGLFLFPFRQEICRFMELNIKAEEQVLLVTAFPVSLGFILTMVGSINPGFFKYSVVRLPIIFDAVMCHDTGEESLVTFDVTPVNCFLRTFEPVDSPEESKVYFECAHLRSPKISFSPVWQNHNSMTVNENIPTGSIVKLNPPGPAFYYFLVRYFFYRVLKGIVYNLKLPGFEGIRRLFMRPSTVMQKEVVYQPGSTVFRQGDAVSTFYYIKKGRVDIYKETDSGDRIFLESLEAGQIFNEMALLGDTRRNVTVICSTLCVLALAHADNLEALIKHNPDFALALVQKLARRVDQTQVALTQTIEYLRKLLQIKETHSRNATILLLWLLGYAFPDGKADLELDTNRLKDKLPGSREDIMAYINQSLSLNDKIIQKENIPDPDTVTIINSVLSAMRIELLSK